MADPFQIVYRPIADLTPADWNPRRISDTEMAKLERAVDEFGMVQPIIVNTRTGLIVGGHQRLDAAAALGHTEVPVIEVDIDEDRAVVLNLALNRIRGQWDADALADLLHRLDDNDVALAGFDDRELGSLEDVFFTAKITHEPKPQDPPETAETQPGDIWQLGDHTLVCGDATSPASYQPFSRQATCLLTDPPYGVEYADMAGHTLANDKPELILDLVSTTLDASRPHLVDRAAWYLFCPSGPAHILHYMAVDRAADYRHRQTLVWVKNRASMSPLGAHYHYQQETALAGEVDPADDPDPRHQIGPEDEAERTREAVPILYGGTGDRMPRFYGGRLQTTALFYGNETIPNAHPTQKPPALLERLLVNSTRPGDAVLDPFAGSGSLLVACEHRNRRALMIELDPRYCDVIVNRYREMTNKRGRRRNDETIAAALADTA